MIFLDLDQDRYIGLPVSALRAGMTSAGFRNLLQRRILIGEGEISFSIAPLNIPRAKLDIGQHPRARLTDALRATLAHCRAPARLSRFGLALTITKLRQLRERLGGVPYEPSPVHLRAAAAFHAIAPLFAHEGACLTRSLALIEVLGTMSAPATLVFGVKTNPFAAHAWVQVGPTVLNDSIDVVRLFTPIESV